MGLRVKSLGKRYERRKTHARSNNIVYMRPMSVRPIGQAAKTNERQTVPFVLKTAPLVLQFCLRSSYKRSCCAKAVS